MKPVSGKSSIRHCWSICRELNNWIEIMFAWTVPPSRQKRGSVIGPAPMDHGRPDTDGSAGNTAGALVVVLLGANIHDSVPPSVLLRNRWVVERTFAWLEQMRRFATWYERRIDIHYVFTLLGSSLICFKRLTKQF